MLFVLFLDKILNIASYEVVDIVELFVVSSFDDVSVDIPLLPLMKHVAIFKITVLSFQKLAAVLGCAIVRLYCGVFVMSILI